MKRIQFLALAMVVGMQGLIAGSLSEAVENNREVVPVAEHNKFEQAQYRCACGKPRPYHRAADVTDENEDLVAGDALDLSNLVDGLEQAAQETDAVRCSCGKPRPHHRDGVLIDVENFEGTELAPEELDEATDVTRCSCGKPWPRR